MFTLENYNYELFYCPFGMSIFSESYYQLCIKRIAQIEARTTRLDDPSFFRMVDVLSLTFQTNSLGTWLQVVSLLLVINIRETLLILGSQNSLWTAYHHRIRILLLSQEFSVSCCKWIWVALSASLDCWVRKSFPMHKTLIFRN